MRAKFANFPPIFRNNLVSKNDFKVVIKTYAEDEGIKCEPRKMVTSLFTLQNGTVIAPLLSYLQLGLELQKYTGMLNTLKRNVPLAVYSRQWTQEEEVTRIQTSV